jgi:uncharacterized protein with ParB-like and HNH nuclease domain
MALTLTAEQKSIYDIFSGKTQYYIPPYQRPYSWQLQHCRELFEDLKREFYNEEKEGYFLGNIVLAWSAENRNRFEVIDGQQRLTTLLLLLKVLLAFDSKNSDIKNAIWIIDSRTKEIKDERLKFSDYLVESDFYREVLKLELNSEICNKEIDKENLFIENICYFYTEIKEMNQYEKIDRFVDFLLYDIYLLPIETGDSTSIKARNKALKVFETINNRGLNLSNADIFKARLYEEALNRLEEDRFIVLWNKFERNINETKYSIDDVFYIYMYVIRGQKAIISRELNIRDFFMNEDNSPFGNIKYDDIINNIIRIVYSIKFFEEVKINPSKYGELTKWFQIVNEYRDGLVLEVPLSSLLAIIQLSYISLEDSKKIVFYFKKLSKYLSVAPLLTDRTSVVIEIVYNKEFINLETLTKLSYFFLHSNNSMKVILSNYLNKNQKAIYPYYFKEIFKSETITDSMFQGNGKNIVMLNSDVKDDITLEENINLLEESGIEDNIKLAKNLRKIPKVKLVDKMIVGAILKKQEKIMNKRIERFLKDEN